MDKIVLEFKLEKETKGALRYKETSTAQAVRTLYIRKQSVLPPAPQNIRVTIEDME